MRDDVFVELPMRWGKEGTGSSLVVNYDKKMKMKGEVIGKFLCEAGVGVSWLGGVP